MGFLWCKMTQTRHDPVYLVRIIGKYGEIQREIISNATGEASWRNVTRVREIRCIMSYVLHPHSYDYNKRIWFGDKCEFLFIFKRGLAILPGHDLWLRHAVRLRRTD